MMQLQIVSEHSLVLGTEMSEEFAAWCVKGTNGGYTITESCSEKLREKLCEHYGE